MVAARTLWESYGALDGGVLAANGRAVLRGLAAQPELNGSPVVVTGWCGSSQRFEIFVEATGERLKAKPANLVALRTPNSHSSSAGGDNGASAADAAETADGATAASARGSHAEANAVAATFAAVDAAPSINDAGAGLAAASGIEVVVALADAHAAPSDCRFGRLPVAVAVAVAYALRVRCVGQLSGSCRAARALLWSEPEALPLWHELLVRRFTAAAHEVVQRARRGAVGPTAYKTARALRLLFKGRVEIVPGSIVDEVDGCDVVACPATRYLVDGGIGAQHAIRRAAGPLLEDDVRKLQLPYRGSVAMVSGGTLATRVAMTMTEPSQEFVETIMAERESPTREETGSVERQLRAIMAFVRKIHVDLVTCVREAGYRSLAMPTLCTGGVGIPPSIVAIAAVSAIQDDFLAHPTDPMRVRIACFDRGQLPGFRSVADEVYGHLFAEDAASRLITELAMVHLRRRERPPS